MVQAADALAAAHDAHIVHRDIKPENLIVTASRHVKVLDFGMAKQVDRQRAFGAADAVTVTRTPTLTRAHTIVGTTAYMSHEQAQALELDEPDIFSLGIVLYELLTGRRAFPGDSADARFDHNNPLWSPDGQRIAFSRWPTRNANAPFSVRTMASDGANPQQVIERLGLNGLFTWMPDGRGIVHVGQGRQLYLLDLASGTERRLTNEPGVMPVVAVTADGKWITSDIWLLTRQ